MQLIADLIASNKNKTHALISAVLIRLAKLGTLLKDTGEALYKFILHNKRNVRED